MRIKWADLSPSTYEDMVAVLLSVLNPETRRVDGSGGDGGRDVQFTDEAGLHVFELKSFTGRLTSSRRRQVKSSLETATTLNPKSWTLVVPIDPNPSELQWFERLQATTPFELEWRGETWLDAQFGAHPFVRRYFLEGGADEAIRLLKDLQKEEAALEGGLPDALGRASKLAERLNELSPYYKFALTLADEVQTVQVMPRYSGAENDHPVTFNLVTSFPDTAEGRAAAEAFRESFDYGTPVELPGEFIESFQVKGLPGTAEITTPDLLRFGAAAQDVNLPFDAIVVAFRPNGVIAAQLPVRFTKRTLGVRGGIVYGSDGTGGLRVRMTFTVPNQTVNVNFQFSTPERALPGELLPALRIMAALRPPNLFNLKMIGHWLNESPVPVPERMFSDDEYIQLIEQLAEIQDHGHAYFPIPQQFSVKDQAAIRDTVELIRGATVEFQWTDATTAMKKAGVERIRELASEVEDMPLEIEADEVLSLFGQEIPIGRVETKMFAARLAEPSEVEAFLASSAAADDILDVRLAAGSTTKGEKRLLPPSPPDGEK